MFPAVILQQWPDNVGVGLLGRGGVARQGPIRCPLVHQGVDAHRVFASVVGGQREVLFTTLTTPESAVYQGA